MTTANDSNRLHDITNLPEDTATREGQSFMPKACTNLPTCYSDRTSQHELDELPHATQRYHNSGSANEHVERGRSSSQSTPSKVYPGTGNPVRPALVTQAGGMPADETSSRDADTDAHREPDVQEQEYVMVPSSSEIQAPTIKTSSSWGAIRLTGGLLLVAMAATAAFRFLSHMLSRGAGGEEEEEPQQDPQLAALEAEMQQMENLGFDQEADLEMLDQEMELEMEFMGDPDDELAMEALEEGDDELDGMDEDELAELEAELDDLAAELEEGGLEGASEVSGSLVGVVSETLVGGATEVLVGEPSGELVAVPAGDKGGVGMGQVGVGEWGVGEIGRAGSLRDEDYVQVGSHPEADE